MPPSLRKSTTSTVTSIESTAFLTWNSQSKVSVTKYKRKAMGRCPRTFWTSICRRIWFLKVDQAFYRVNLDTATNIPSTIVTFQRYILKTKVSDHQLTLRILWLSILKADNSLDCLNDFLLAPNTVYNQRNTNLHKRWLSKTSLKWIFDNKSLAVLKYSPKRDSNKLCLLRENLWWTVLKCKGLGSR